MHYDREMIGPCEDVGTEDGRERGEDARWQMPV